MKVTNGLMFQFIAIFLIQSCIDCFVPYLVGIAFLEKIPIAFQCRELVPGSVTDFVWKDCNRKHICDAELPYDMFRPIKSQSQYLNNWAMKLHLVCRPYYEVGLIGSSFFFGLMIMIVPVPMLADKYGRKQVFVTTIIVSIAIQISLIYVNGFDDAISCMFVLGMTYPGRQIVGTFYITELIPESMRSGALLFTSLFGSIMSILMTSYYRFISVDTHGLQILFVIYGSINLIFVMLIVPESPKYLYNTKQYE